jgi:hypothetical protein
MDRRSFAKSISSIAFAGMLPASASVSTTVSSQTLSQKVNHVGRELASLPSFDSPILFNSTEADRVLAAMQIMLVNSAWNESIMSNSVSVLSDSIIERIGRNKQLKVNYDMGFILIPPRQPFVPLKVVGYPKESDAGPYPIPDNAPIDNWPMDGSDLSQLQREGQGDRHVLVVDPWNQKLYELGEAYKKDGYWEAGASAIFDLNTNRMRPATWTSADAAGLPIFPAVVRFDEVERGLVEHAMRFTVQSTRRLFIYPARHYASRITDSNLPAMGQRFRLRPNVDLSDLSKHARAVALGLQKFGMFVADNGGDMRMSVAPDPRITGLEGLSRFKTSDFEVVTTTGEFEGNRSGSTK